MEMSYGGTLVMPKSYAVMDQKEMCYVEGGGMSLSKAKDLGIAFLAVVGAVNTVIQAFEYAVKYGRKIKGIAQSKFVKGVASKAAGCISRIVSWIGAHMNFLAGILAGLLAGATAYVVFKDVATTVYKRYA